MIVFHHANFDTQWLETYSQTSDNDSAEEYIILPMQAKVDTGLQRYWFGPRREHGHRDSSVLRLSAPSHVRTYQTWNKCPWNVLRTT